MSTRFNIDHGENHRLHGRIFEAGKVYLELTGAGFVASPGVVTVAIPADVWEQIRAHGVEEFRDHWFEADAEESAEEAIAPTGSTTIPLGSPVLAMPAGTWRFTSDGEDPLR